MRHDRYDREGAVVIEFDFPPLGPTGEGSAKQPPDGNRDNRAYWEGGAYAVTHQWDRPAVAFRCHYPGGSSPCDQTTADRFIEWATAFTSKGQT